MGGIVAAVMESMKQLATRLEELQQQYQEILSKIKEAIEATYPRLKESYSKIYNQFVSTLDTVLNVATAYFKAILNLINEHQKELKELASIGSEIIHDVAKIVTKIVSEINKDIDEFYKLLIDQVKALPIYEFAQQKYEELANFQIPPGLLASIEELGNAVKAILPTEELQKLFEVTYDYIMKHVKREKVGFPPFVLTSHLPFQVDSRALRTQPE